MTALAPELTLSLSLTSVRTRPSPAFVHRASDKRRSYTPQRAIPSPHTYREARVLLLSQPEKPVGQLGYQYSMLWVGCQRSIVKKKNAAAAQKLGSGHVEEKHAGIASRIADPAAVVSNHYFD
ncbi:hypothetical protein EW146_g6154 [Bondarzewia mesenterica]|uniref:Uncharacterized protein n=1 Tax=Bondarzewia mesenterica TaxID=1095465 RepID=A0A4S4LQ05_9AGAM|nr:hypothetical protein EW146_g6154 [Bondarzewia mesenterica]